jgi:hypothetical protein
MNKMNTFKKTLLATSALGFASVSLGATVGTGVETTAGVTLDTPSIQEVATLDLFEIDGPHVHLGANYGVGDTIALTFSGASLDEDFLFDTAAITAVQATTDDGAGNDIAAVCGGMTVAFAGLQGSVATYTVSSVGGNTIDCAIPLEDIDVDGASFAAADTFSVAVATSRGFGTLESVAATELGNVAAAEIAVTVGGTVLDGIIDVNDARNTLTDNDAVAPAVELTDTVSFTLVDPATGPEIVAGESTMTITGDFSWAAVTALNGTVSYPGIGITYDDDGAGANAAAAVAAGDITASASAVTWVATNDGVYEVTLTPPLSVAAGGSGLVTLPATAYTFSANIVYTNGTDNAAADQIDLAVASASAGAWTLNGASITALGVSNSPSVTPMIWIQNSGTSNGAISGSVNCNGSTITIADLGTAAALSNTKVGELIQAAVEADGSCPTTNTRYDATVTVNAPATAITMNASYKVTAADGATDRVMLETSDSLPAASN